MSFFAGVTSNTSNTAPPVSPQPLLLFGRGEEVGRVTSSERVSNSVQNSSAGGRSSYFVENDMMREGKSAGGLDSGAEQSDSNNETQLHAFELDNSAPSSESRKDAPSRNDAFSNCDEDCKEEDIPESIFLPKDLVIVNHQKGEGLAASKAPIPQGVAGGKRRRGPPRNAPNGNSVIPTVTSSAHGEEGGRGDSRYGGRHRWEKEDGISTKDNRQSKQSKAEAYLCTLRQEMKQPGHSCAYCDQAGREAAKYCFEQCFESGHLMTSNGGQGAVACQLCQGTKHPKGVYCRCVCCFFLCARQGRNKGCSVHMYQGIFKCGQGVLLRDADGCFAQAPSSFTTATGVVIRRNCFDVLPHNLLLKVAAKGIRARHVRAIRNVN